MKQLFRFFALMTICLVTSGAWAQTWTASAVGENTFYIYSVSEDKFLDAGTFYGCRASLVTHGGIPLTLTAVSAASGIYSVSTAPTFTNCYMGVGTDNNEAYFDVARSNSTQYSNWKFIEVEGEPNTYLIQAVKNSKYMVAHENTPDRTSVTSTAVPTTSKGWWKLVTKDDLMANLANATEENPVDATFTVLNHTFCASSASKPRWTGDYTDWGGVDDNQCVEQWNRTFDMYQTVTGLPNGVYKMNLQGFYRLGDGDQAAKAKNNGTESLNSKYYINDTEGSLKSIFDDDVTLTNNSTYNTSGAVTVNGTQRYLPNNLSRAAACMRDGYYWNEPIMAVVTDGTVKLGFRKTELVGNDWAAIDNVVLTYYGSGLSVLVSSYQELLATAKALQGEPMQASVKTNLEHTITSAQRDVNTNSSESLESAIASLNTAIQTAQASNALYTGAILIAVNGMKAQSTSESVKSELQSKYEAGVYDTADDVYATYQPLEIAALPHEANTSFTSAIINPGFELGNMDGWSVKTVGNDTGVYSTENTTYAFSGTEGNYLFNTWASGIKTLDIEQTITGLPAGYYKLSATVATFGDEAAVVMTANGATAYVTPKADDVDGEKKVGHELVLEEILVGDGTLTFSLQNTGKGQTLLKADNFQLTYTEPYEAPTTFTNLTFDLDVENSEVSKFLANTTYDESTATAVTNYATDASLHYDQPAKIRVPLPSQTTDATLSLALNSSYTGAETCTVPARSVLYEIKNLIPQQTYYYKIEANGSIIANGTINTTGRLRMIKSEGISNMRDLGGWLNADGNRLRYGKIYRGSELTGGKTYTASDSDLKMLANLGIAAEVDLREDGDLANGTLSSSAISGASYYYANLNRWNEDAMNLDTQKLKQAFNLILTALKAGKAAYFHCIFGADRTGCLAFLLEGLLGLPVDQLYKDYELTSFSSAGLREKKGIDNKLQYIKSLQGSTLQEKFYNYWRGAVGVSQSDLNTFINIMVEGTSPITTATLANLPTKAVADGEYYIYLPTKGKFLGRGEAYGARGLADNYGVPALVTTNGANVTTIKYLDSNLYLGSDCYTDKGSGYNSVSWFVERQGDNYVLRSHNGFYMGESSDNGFMKPRTEVTNASSALPVAFKSAAEQKNIVAAIQKKKILSAAAAAGITANTVEEFKATLAADYIAMSPTVTIKSPTSGSTANWPLTQPSLITSISENGGSNYNVGNYGGELYQTHGYISQTVTVPRAGLYKLTLNALYRQGTCENCYALGQKGYELSNAYVSVNGDYFAQIPSWYSDAAGSENPNNTDQARALISAGKYAIELWAYIGEEKTAEIRVNVPGFTPWGWCLFNNFVLTEYVKNGTGIDKTECEAWSMEGEANAIYNIAGQRLQEPQRGVNIINGKKVFYSK